MPDWYVAADKRHRGEVVATCLQHRPQWADPVAHKIALGLFCAEILQAQDLLRLVSIHAPTWGATSTFDVVQEISTFQSTRPRGARPRIQ